MTAVFDERGTAEPKRTTGTLVFDSYAWIEYFAGTAEGKTVDALLKGGEIVYTPAVCLTEIKNKYSSAGFKHAETEKRIGLIKKSSTVSPITAETALLAADLMQQHGLHTVDALVYACAKEAGGRLVTGDKHFEKLPEVEFLK